MSTTACKVIEINRPSVGCDLLILRGMAISNCQGQTSDFELGIFEYDFSDGSVLILRGGHPAMSFESR